MAESSAAAGWDAASKGAFFPPTKRRARRKRRRRDFLLPRKSNPSSMAPSLWTMKSCARGQMGNLEGYSEPRRVTSKGIVNPGLIWIFGAFRGKSGQVKPKKTNSYRSQPTTKGQKGQKGEKWRWRLWELWCPHLPLFKTGTGVAQRVHLPVQKTG